MNEFTARHNGELPDQQGANLAALGRLNEQLVMIMLRRNELTKQLAQLTDPGAASNTIPARLAKLRLELADLRAQHTDSYPDVVRVKEEIADLERQLAAGGRSAAAQDPRGGIEAELNVLRNNEQAVRRAIAGYEQRVEKASAGAQQLQQLTQDYTMAKHFYESLLQRYQDAQLAAGLAQQRLRGEQFRILDLAVPSPRPLAPHHFGLILLGLLVSVGAAVGEVSLAEWLDTSFHSVDNMRAFTSVPVMVSIPPILTNADVRRRGRQFGVCALAAVLLVGAMVGGLSHLVRVNDTLVRLLTASRF